MGLDNGANVCVSFETWVVHSIVTLLVCLRPSLPLDADPARAFVCVARPYTMVFVGINGVGKSTSLSKVCYYLKSHGLKVRQDTIAITYAGHRL